MQQKCKKSQKYFNNAQQMQQQMPTNLKITSTMHENTLSHCARGIQREWAWQLPTPKELSQSVCAGVVPALSPYLMRGLPKRPRKFCDSKPRGQAPLARLQSIGGLLIHPSVLFEAIQNPSEPIRILSINPSVFFSSRQALVASEICIFFVMSTVWVANC